MEFLDLINRDTGPAGTGIQILGTYENEEKLRLEHPTGVVGDCYMVNNSLYIYGIKILMIGTNQQILKVPLVQKGIEVLKVH